MNSLPCDNRSNHRNAYNTEINASFVGKYSDSNDGIVNDSDINSLNIFINTQTMILMTKLTNDYNNNDINEEHSDNKWYFFTSR